MILPFYFESTIGRFKRYFCLGATVSLIPVVSTHARSPFDNLPPPAVDTKSRSPFDKQKLQSQSATIPNHSPSPPSATSNDQVAKPHVKQTKDDPSQIRASSLLPPQVQSTKPNNQHPQEQPSHHSRTVQKPSDLWNSLLNFRPSQTVQENVMAHRERQLQFLGYGPAYINWFVQRIEDGVGPASLDYFPVHVRHLPKINGRELKPEEVLHFMRLHLNGFAPTSLSYFEPYNYKAVCRRVELGGFVYIALGNDVLVSSGPNTTYAVNLEAGSVVVSLLEPHRWRFSTIYANAHRYLTDSGRTHPKAPRSQTSSGGFYHPVSGNREFGFEPHPDGGWIFYTCGVDRTSCWSFVPESIRHTVSATAFDEVATLRMFPTFAAQRLMWQGMQRRLIAFIRAAGGEAEMLDVEGEREFAQVFISWQMLMKNGVFKPKVPWVDFLGEDSRYWSDKAPTHASVLPETLRAMDQIATWTMQGDPPRLFEVPEWMKPLQKHLPQRKP